MVTSSPASASRSCRHRTRCRTRLVWQHRSASPRCLCRKAAIKLAIHHVMEKRSEHLNRLHALTELQNMLGGVESPFFSTHGVLHQNGQFLHLHHGHLDRQAPECLIEQNNKSIDRCDSHAVMLFGSRQQPVGCPKCRHLNTDGRCVWAGASCHDRNRAMLRCGNIACPAKARL